MTLSDLLRSAAALLRGRPVESPPPAPPPPAPLGEPGKSWAQQTRFWPTFAWKRWWLSRSNPLGTVECCIGPYDSFERARQEADALNRLNGVEHADG